MTKVILTGYTIRVRESRSKDYKTLRKFDGGTGNLFGTFNEFLKNRIGHSNIENLGDQKTIFYDGLQIINNPSYINFIAYVGAYGTAYQLLDHTSGNLKYTRNTKDTDAFPLQFTIYIPDVNSKIPDIGILISEKYKNKAAKGLFETHFKDYFLRKFPGYILEMEPIIPEEFYTFFEKGIITTTRMKSYSIPQNIEDSYQSGTSTKGKTSIELVIKNEDLKKRVKDSILKRFKEKRHGDLSTLFTGYPITPEEISFTGTLNGKQATVILKEDGETMVPGIDVTDRVSFSNYTGFPIDDSMRSIEIEYLNELITKNK